MMTDEKPQNEIPNALTGRISSRYATLSALAQLIISINDPNFTDLSSDKHVQPVFLTDSAQITGEVKIVAEEPFDVTCQEVLSTSRNHLVRELEKENEIVNVMGNSAYILVKNAVLRPFSNPSQTFNYDSLYLFVDDIRGFSLTETE